MKSWQKNETIEDLFNELEKMMEAKIKISEENRYRDWRACKKIHEEELIPSKKRAVELFHKLDQNKINEVKRLLL